MARSSSLFAAAAVGAENGAVLRDTGILLAEILHSSILDVVVGAAYWQLSARLVRCQLGFG